MSKKVLFILMPQDFKDAEFKIPYEHLQKAGYLVDVAGLEPGDTIGCNGLRHTPDLLLHNLSEDDIKGYEALIIPGGPGSPDYLWHQPHLQKIVQLFHEYGKIIATICWACVVPAQAGILSGKKATVYPSDDALAIFAEHNVSFVDTGCVALIDEKIVTAQNPDYASDFAHAIVSLLMVK